jgi:cobalt-zinc-cadmium efflux system outer membrane protein
MARGLAVAALAVVVCSCAPPTSEATGPYPSPDGRSVVVPAVDQLSATPTGSSPVVGEFVLAQALSRAWTEHPDMRVALAQLGSTHGAQLQAKLRPNPRLGVSYIDEDGQKTGAFVSLGVPIELGNKRRRRMELARASSDRAQAELIDTWMRLRARIVIAFVECAYERAVARGVRRIAELTDESYSLTEGLVAVGKASRVDLLKAKERLAAARASRTAQDARAAHAARDVLLAPGIVPSGADVGIVCELEAPSATSERFDALESAAAEASPRLASARIATAIAEARVSLARAKRIPDANLSVSVGSVTKESGEGFEAYQAAVNSELPLFDRNQGGIIGSRYDLAGARAAHRSAHLAVAATLSAVLADLAGLRARLAAFTDTILPAAEERLAFANTQVVAERMSRLDYLAQEIELERTRLEHAAVMRALAIAHARLEEVVGVLTVSPSPLREGAGGRGDR